MDSELETISTLDRVAGRLVTLPSPTILRDLSDGKVLQSVKLGGK